MKAIEIEPNTKQRKPGRPRAIPEDRIQEVISLHESGLGYRAIAHELERKDVFADWSTVRRVIKKRQIEKGHNNASSSNCDTILPLGNQQNLGSTLKTGLRRS
jgi:hypothetical protein